MSSLRNKIFDWYLTSAGAAPDIAPSLFPDLCAFGALKKKTTEMILVHIILCESDISFFFPPPRYD